MNAKTSLKHRGAPLADPTQQLVHLKPKNESDKFDERLAKFGHSPLTPSKIEILQVNLGRLCNMTCEHCHVDAGPDRKEENMRDPEIDACLEVLRRHPQIHTLDLTGGAPEMNPGFRRMVKVARELGRHVIDRCNLTILLANGFTDLPEFLSTHQVEIVASLPCYLEENTDAQRGDGAFSKSIEALQTLNRFGYGMPDSGLTLTLVYNPVGAGLPPDQANLEAAYREQLRDRFGIEFSRLFTITNMPVSRYLEYLLNTGEYNGYMKKLVDAFNPATIKGLMCRNTISVSWDGKLYDCDFNQMLELQLQDIATIHDFDLAALENREIVVAQHCFGCTAGCGSGCQGAIDN